MKKMIALLLVMAVCFAFAACGKKPVQSQIENFEEKTKVELVTESVNSMLASEEYQKKNAAFETAIGSESRAPKVTYVMEYQNDNFDGFALHLLLINVELDYMVNNGIFDRTTLVVDMTNGKWCDEVRSDFNKWQKSFGGVCKSIEDCYFIFLQPTFLDAGTSGTVFWSESETYYVLNDEELAQINQGLVNE